VFLGHPVECKRGAASCVDGLLVWSTSRCSVAC